jgi:acetyl-CoA carboxylase biotin carboxyl carrier protein
MDFNEIQELIKLINKSNLAEFRMKNGDFKIVIRTDKFSKGKIQPPIMLSQQIAQPATQSATVQTIPTPAPIAIADTGNPHSNKEKSTPAVPDKSHLLTIKSPMVGTFYRSPSPAKPIYAKVGDVIHKGSIVCLIEAMKLFNEIESDIAGKVVEILADDASPVEYDQPLFLIDPKG